MKAVRLHEAAKRELADEALYFAAISPRLGERFIAAVEAATSLAAEFPSIGSPYRVTGLQTPNSPRVPEEVSLLYRIR